MKNDGIIFLRRVQPSDLNQLLAWENDEKFWVVSDRDRSIHPIEMGAFLKEQERSVYELNQVRWIIQEQFSRRMIGTLDLYEIDWEQNLAYVGILIANQSDRGKGYATEAVKRLEHLVAEEWSLSCIKARIQEGNTASLNFFRKLGYVEKKKLAQKNSMIGSKFNYLTFEKWLNE